MDEHVITIENLTKFYDGRCVLEDINLKIPRGCIYGLLGRNGAGKTTLVRILLGLEPATRGQTYIFGKESNQLGATDRAKIGYVAEGHHLIGDYKVERLVGFCKSLSKEWNEEFFRHLITTFRLPMDRKIKELSTGMRAQLNLCLAMAINPELLILDDPTLGLDTVVRRQFLKLAIDVIQREGRTVLFSSHILNDVERIADRIGILVGGKLVVDCSLEELKRRVRKLRLIFTDGVPDKLYLTDIIREQRSESELVMTVVDWDGMKQAILDLYKPANCIDVPMTLEDIFIECTNPKPAAIAD
jgi:ABC-2 type transport system ATP-binding protein